MNINTTNHGAHFESHGSLKSYIIGFILSITLTLIPYYIVTTHAMSIPTTYALILLFAVLQFIIQVVFFLHVTEGQDSKWNIMALVFTIVVLLILVFGSMWIMYNLDYNMMH